MYDRVCVQEGKTALDLAKEKDKHDVAKLIEVRLAIRCVRIISDGLCFASLDHVEMTCFCAILYFVHFFTSRMLSLWRCDESIVGRASVVAMILRTLIHMPSEMFSFFNRT